MLVDSHCHLDFPDFDGEVDEIRARAHEAGVGLMLTISTSLKTFPAVRGIAEKYDDVYCSVGVHPHEAEKEPDTATAQLIELAAHPAVVGIGETGLDYYYEHSPRDVQQTVFRAHIAAARETGLPLIVHTRDADDDMIAILTDEMGKGAFPGLIHCFSAGPDLALKAVDLGMYISFSGILTFKKADEIRQVAADLPADRILVETDAPFLAPMPNRGKRNEPAYVAHTAACLAEARGLPAAELEALTTANFLTLFSKIDAPNLPTSP
ncbi:MAG: TatD family hydrolase [Rhodospirillales bacterium]|nr:TatD family hydrolase [Rhodospirillales bacterium]